MTTQNWFMTFREGNKGGLTDEYPLPAQVKSFQEFIGRSHAESLIMAWLCMNYKKREGKHVNLLFEKLSEKVAIEMLTDAFIDLVASGFVQLNPEDYSEGAYSIIFTHRVEVALRTGNDELFKRKKPILQGDDRITLRMYAHAVMFKTKVTDADNWLYKSNFFLYYFDTEISKMIRRAKLDRFTKAVVLYIYVMHAVEGSSTDWRFLSQLFSENKMEARRLLNQWKKPDWKPIQRGLIDVKQYPIGPMVLIPSEEIQQKIYGMGGDDTKVENKLPYALQIITADQIVPRKLFFNPNELEQIELFREMVTPNNFKKYQRLMCQAGKPAGITVLLSGGPGTGKTELALQVARISGRDLLIFDVSEQRDKYFGESEKRIKEIFQYYSEATSSTYRAPILFFNEADSVFQKRSSNETSMSSTENTIQTILLNELERFNGIMICTTNRPDSFDTAFNRRFDFKITINPPEAPIRLQLLKQLYTNIPMATLLKLAEQYTFTGAELENFSKIYCMHSLIKKEHAIANTASALRDYLASNQNKSNSVIGFRLK